MNEPRKVRARRKAAAALVALQIASAAAEVADPILKEPLTAAAITANTERTFEAISGLPQGDLLLPYQSTALALVTQHQLIVIEKSRRIGLTWALAADAVLTAAARKGEGGDDCLYISYSQEMTREFMDACAMWARAFMGVTAESGEFLFDDQVPGSTDTKQIKAFRHKFASGFEIVALSSSPRSLRGKQGKVIIDEAAFVDNLEQLLTAALALTIWGSKIIVVSTHNGVDNPFNTLCEDVKTGKQDGGHLKITFDQAIADGLYERVKLVTGTPLSKDEWVAKIRGIYRGRSDEELDCIPSAGKGAFISPELITSCTSPEAGKPEFYTGKASALGWDIARKTHLSVMAPFEMVGLKLILREQIELTNVPFKKQGARFDETMKRYRVVKARLDQTGLGMDRVETAQDTHGSSTVEGVTFTPAMKLVLANLLKDRFENGLIEIPDDPAVRADLRSIKRSGNGTGAPIFEAEGSRRQEKGDTAGQPDKSHGDRFWAYALACLAAEAGLGTIAFFVAEREGQTNFPATADGEPDLTHSFGVLGGGIANDMGDY